MLRSGSGVDRGHRADASAGAVIFLVSHNAANVLNYAYLVLISQLLEPAAFALFGALFGAIYLASALANTLQMSTAAAVAANPAAAADAVAVRVRALVRWAPLFLAGGSLVAWPMAMFLHTRDIPALLLTAAAIWLFFFASSGYGALQGRERFAFLGAGLFIAAAVRLVIGPVLLVLGMGITGAMLGIVLGLAFSAVFVLAPFRSGGWTAAGHPVLSIGSLTPPLLVSIAIAAPTSIDVVLARHYLPGADAGAYAAVSVLGKIVIFGPLAVSLALFPAMVRGHVDGSPSLRTLERGLTATAILAVPLAAITILAATAASGVVLRGYDAPAALVVTYLTAMLAFSLVIPLVYHDLAAGRVRAVACVLLVLLSEAAVLSLWHPGPLAFASVLLAGNAGIGGVLLMAVLRAGREERRRARRADALAPAA